MVRYPKSYPPRRATRASSKNFRTISIFGKLIHSSVGRPTRAAQTSKKLVRVIMFMRTIEDSEKGVLLPLEVFEAMDRFTEQLVDAGIMLPSAGLTPSAQS